MTNLVSKSKGRGNEPNRKIFITSTYNIESFNATTGNQRTVLKIVFI